MFFFRRIAILWLITRHEKNVSLRAIYSHRVEVGRSLFYMQPTLDVLIFRFATASEKERWSE
jgi:hypothetical protein